MLNHILFRHPGHIAVTVFHGPISLGDVATAATALGRKLSHTGSPVHWILDLTAREDLRPDLFDIGPCIAFLRQDSLPERLGHVVVVDAQPNQRMVFMMALACKGICKPLHVAPNLRAAVKLLDELDAQPASAYC